MAHGLPNADPLQSADGSKVKVEAGELVSKDSGVRELLYAVLLELQAIRQVLSESPEEHPFWFRSP